MKALRSETSAVPPSQRTAPHPRQLKALLISVVLGIGSLSSSLGSVGDGLLNYWNFEGNFNDTAGTAVGSTSTEADNGTAANPALATIQSAGGILDQFVRLSQSHIVVPNSADILAGGESLSISAWFRVASFGPSWQALIAHGEASDYRIARRDAASVMSYAGGVGDIPASAIGPDVNDAAWHHIVAISEAAVSTRLWVDGELVETGGAPTLTNNGSANLWIGANPDAGGRDWNGDIDEVAMWDRPLTDAEISEIYTRGREGTPLSNIFVFNSLPTIGAATLTGQTVSVVFTDSATNQVDVTKPRSMQIDGVNATPTSISKVGPVTTLSYTSPTAYPPGALLSVQVSVTTTNNTSVTGTRSARAPFVSNIIGGGKWDTEHVWTHSSPTMTLATAEEALNAPGAFPPEDSIITKTSFIHFHDDVAPPLFVAESTPYPLWDPVNGGAGFGNREDFAIRCRGQINIVSAGKCWFICNSDDGFALRIDGTEVGTAPDRGRANSVMSVDLTAGVHDVEFVHWERGGGAGVSLYVFKGISDTDPPIGEDSYELLQVWLNTADADGDGMLDSYENANGLNPAVNDAAADKDGDTLSNLTEFQRNTRADKPDTDDDGLNDPVETNTGTYVNATNTGTNPVVSDTDGDSLRDGAETNTNVFVNAGNAGTNPFVRDTDSDGLIDGAEVILGSNPLSPASLATVIEGGGKFTTEHVWTQSNPTLTGGGAEAVLDDPSVFPPEDSITVETTYIHFHDNVAPPWFVPESKPYPLWDPDNGGPGFADREDYALRSRGKIKITKPGMVWFNCNSDDGFFLRVDGTELGTAPDRARADTVMSADLAIGLHDVELVHWERAGGAGVSVLVYRAITDTAPAVSGNTWQLLEAAPTAPATTLAITAFTYNPATSLLNLTFTSSAGSNYALEYTVGFQPAGAPASSAKWTVVPSHSSIAGAAGTTAITPLNVNTLVAPGGQLPNNSQVYLRVRKL